MKIKLSYQSVATLSLCFAFGLVWGLYATPNLKNRLFNRDPIRILLIKGTLPEDIIESYRIESKSDVQVTYAQDELEAQKILDTKAQDYDLVTLMSHQVSRLIQVNKIQTLDPDLIANKSNIATDFKYPPFDREGKYIVPLLWGINGYIYNQERVPSNLNSVQDIFQNKYKKKISIKNSPLDIFSNLIMRKKISDENIALGEIKIIKNAVGDLADYIQINTQDLKRQLLQEDVWIAQVDSGTASGFISENQKFKYVIPEDGATIWTLNMAIVTGTSNLKQAHKFLNYLLRKDIAIDLAKTSHHAVTNSLAENDSTLNARLKPSYLRNTAIHNLKYYEGLGQFDNKIQTLFKVSDNSGLPIVREPAAKKSHIEAPTASDEEAE